MATRKRKTPLAKKVVEEEVVEEVEKERNAQVKAIDFVPIWQECESTEAVAEHFDRDSIWASAFASRLRKMGVNLKKMERASRKSLDVDVLNALID